MNFNNKTVFILFLLISSLGSNAQHQYAEIESAFLDQNRGIKIQLPRSYNPNDIKEYPILIVLSGDYLFEPIAGMVDYLSYWDEIPEAIVVGVLQNETKNEDFLIDDQTYLPFLTGEAFFNFLELELITYIEKKYRTLPFRIIAGHGESANFSNFFLLKENQLFQTYINFSPFYTPNMPSRIYAALEKVNQKTWYYHGYSANEPKIELKKMNDMAQEAESFTNANLTFYTDVHENATHFTSVSQGVANALENIFTVFKPITPLVYQKELILKESPVAYLKDKYFEMASLFSIKIDIRINDIMFTSKAIEENEKWEEYKDLSKLAKKHHPETLLESYFLARYNQEIGNPKKAMKYYQEAYSGMAVGQLTPDLMLARVKEIQRVFGY